MNDNKAIIINPDDEVIEAGDYKIIIKDPRFWKWFGYVSIACAIVAGIYYYITG